MLQPRFDGFLAFSLVVQLKSGVLIVLSEQLFSEMQYGMLLSSSSLERDPSDMK